MRKHNVHSVPCQVYGAVKMHCSKILRVYLRLINAAVGIFLYFIKNLVLVQKSSSFCIVLVIKLLYLLFDSLRLSYIQDAQR